MRPVLVIVAFMGPLAACSVETQAPESAEGTTTTSGKPSQPGEKGCGPQIDCDDGNPCTVDSCVRGEGCVHAPADGVACDDGDACTRVDLCSGGACVGSDPVVCTAADGCHTAGTCDSTTGLCSSPNAPDGTTCDDGDACTQVDACLSGACVGSSPVVCTATDACHAAGTCDPATGTCSNPSAPDGTSCATASNATTACESGICVITTCAPGYADCNTSVSDGCEVDLSEDSSCGGCGVVCPAGTHCTNLQCAPVAVPQPLTLTVAVTANSATITWTSNVATTTSLQWGPGISITELVPDDGVLQTTHSVTLTGLSSGSAYSYIPGGKDAYGDPLYVFQRTFRTLFI